MNVVTVRIDLIIYIINNYEGTATGATAATHTTPDNHAHNNCTYCNHTKCRRVSSGAAYHWTLYIWYADF